MATYNWLTGTPGDWSTAADWGGTIPTSSDTAVLAAATTGNKTPYTVTVNSGETYTVAAADLGFSSVHSGPSLSITGSLTIGSLVYIAGNSGANPITVNAGGTLDITTSITADTAQTAETITIAGTGTGSLLKLGSTTVYNAAETFTFANNATAINAGVVEYLSGFSTGLNSAQAITGFAWGDKIEFAGANFTGDTYTYSGTTLTIKSGATTVLTMSNLTSTGSGFTLSGNSITVVCYAAGTHILTPTGERRVETLRQGDMDFTVSGDEQVSSRSSGSAGGASTDRGSRGRKRWRPFASGAGRSPTTCRTAICGLAGPRDPLDGKLICARQLVNGATIHQERADLGGVFPRRAGCPCDPARGGPAGGKLPRTPATAASSPTRASRLCCTRPDGRSRLPDARGGSCRAVRVGRESVRPVWQRLAERADAGAAGAAARCDHRSGAAIVCQGPDAAAAVWRERAVIFALPKGRRRCAWSRVPAHRRMRGRGWTIAAASACTWKRIVLRGRTRCGRSGRPSEPVARLAGGGADGAALRRWTSGDAVLPLPAAGGTMLEIRAGDGGMTYVTKEVRQAAVMSGFKIPGRKVPTGAFLSGCLP